MKLGVLACGLMLGMACSDRHCASTMQIADGRHSLPAATSTDGTLTLEEGYESLIGEEGYESVRGEGVTLVVESSDPQEFTASFESTSSGSILGPEPGAQSYVLNCLTPGGGTLTFALVPENFDGTAADAACSQPVAVECTEPLTKTSCTNEDPYTSPSDDCSDGSFTSDPSCTGYETADITSVCGEVEAGAAVGDFVVTVGLATPYIVDAGSRNDRHQFTLYLTPTDGSGEVQFIAIGDDGAEPSIVSGDMNGETASIDGMGRLVYRVTAATIAAIGPISTYRVDTYLSIIGTDGYRSDDSEVYAYPVP
jgi:hypothetical protein